MAFFFQAAVPRHAGSPCVPSVPKQLSQSPGGHWVSLGTWHPPACATGCGGGAAVEGTPRGCTRPSSQEEGRAISPLLTPGVHSWEQGDSPREASGVLAETWIPLDTKPTPSPPKGPWLRVEEPSHQRLRGSHISFNSNIRVLNIQRARGQGGIYSASKYTASTDRDKLKTAREEKVLLALPQPALWAGGAATMPKGASTGCLLAQDFPQEKKEVLSDVKPVTK